MRLIHGLFAVALFIGGEAIAQSEQERENLLSTFDRSVAGRSHFIMPLATKRERSDDAQSKGVWRGTSSKASTLISPAVTFRDEQSGEEMKLSVEYSVNDKGNLLYEVQGEGFDDVIKGQWITPGGMGRPMKSRNLSTSLHSSGAGLLVVQPTVPNFEDGFGLELCVFQGKKAGVLTSFVPAKAEFSVTARGEGGFSSALKRGSAQVEIRGNAAIKVVPPTVDKVYDYSPSASSAQRKTPPAEALILKEGVPAVAQVDVDVDFKNAAGYRRTETRTERLLVVPHYASPNVRRDLIRWNPVSRYEESPIPCTSLITYRFTETSYSKEAPLEEQPK